MEWPIDNRLLHLGRMTTKSFDNEYFINMRDMQYKRVVDPNQKIVYWEAEGLIMLTSDLVLWKDILPYKTNGEYAGVRCGEFVELQACDDSPTAEVVVDYASNNTLFYEEYATVWDKMLSTKTNNLRRPPIRLQSVVLAYIGSSKAQFTPL